MNLDIFEEKNCPPYLFSPIEFFHCDIFGDEVSLIGEARWGKNQVKLELPALLPLVRAEICHSISELK